MITWKGYPIKVIYHLNWDNNLVGIKIGKCLRVVVIPERLLYFLMLLQIYETEPRTRKMEN